MKIKTKKGFTLVEIIAVVAVLGIMTGVALVSMTSSRQSASLRAAQSEVASAINMARSYALQGKIPTGQTDVCGWGFEFFNRTRYQIFVWKKVPNSMGIPECNPTAHFNHPSNAGSTWVAELSPEFKNGIRLRMTGANIPERTRVLFDIPNGNTTICNWTGGTPPISPILGGETYTLETNDGSTTKTYTVNSKGMVTENP